MNKANFLILQISPLVGYSDILQATNGQEALDLLAQVDSTQPDDPVKVILMDASMDVMDGLEATRIIRSRQASNRLAPWIIGQTAHVSDSFRRECSEAGMVSKSVHSEEACANEYRLPSIFAC